MKNRDRLFIGTCAGMPFGLVGMGIGFLFSFLWNKFIAEQEVKQVVNENMNEEKQYEDFKRLVENTDFWNTFVHIEGKEDK